MFKQAFVVVSVVVLGACTTVQQPPVPMNFQQLDNATNPVGLVFQPVPDPTLVLPGADCLLCLAAAAAANSGLSGVVKGYSADDIRELESMLTKQLEDEGKTVIPIKDLQINKLSKFKTDGTGFARKDFREISSEHGVDHVVVVNLAHVGATRPYASYVPTGAPYASITGTAYAVSREDNAYVWYLPINLQMQADGDWKEEPDYHNVTNAYYRLVEELRDTLTNALTRQTMPAESPMELEGDNITAED